MILEVTNGTLKHVQIICYRQIKDALDCFAIDSRMLN